MDVLPDVTSVEYLGGFRLRLRFSDGSAGEVDFEGRFDSKPGLLHDLADRAFFARVYLDEDAGTVAWPNGVDLDPLVLWSEATGRPLPIPAARDA